MGLKIESRLKNGEVPYSKYRRNIHILMITLYKTYVLPNFEYCSPLLLGISRTLNNKLERANHYAVRSILNLGSSVTHDACLSIASMTSLEQRRIEHSLIVFFQSFRMHGPNYISNFFKPRVTNYNLRGSGLNVSQPSYNNRFKHNSFSYFYCPYVEKFAMVY